MLPHAITAARIAFALRVPLHRVRWVLRTRPDIKPLILAGNAKLYSRAAIARVSYELTLQDVKRQSRKAVDNAR